MPYRPNHCFVSEAISVIKLTKQRVKRFGIGRPTASRISLFGEGVLPMYDIVISLDGTEAPRFIGDVAIDGDRIVAVAGTATFGNSEETGARRERLVRSGT